MKKILLLTLGGTIACVKTKKGLTPRLKAKDLLALVRVPRGVKVEFFDFLERTIVFPEDWIVLSRQIFAAYNSYDGFVITLGTDTLAYVSCALSLMLQNLSKPVVLTGAMEVIKTPQSDGRQNLKDAIGLAAQSTIGGVFVVFNGNIFDGGIVSKVRSDAASAFESINYPALGYLKRNRVHWRNNPPNRKGRLKLAAWLDARVIVVKLTPQLGADFFKSLSSYRGIVMEGYGDGNVPSHLVSAILDLAKNKIVVLASQCPYGQVRHQYEGGTALIRKGVISSRAMTKEMACVKLMWALGQSKVRYKVRSIFEGKQ